ncbi:MAG TPA: 50S ribosomal protein L10 [Bacteroidaceae bacterium]|jgi:large subunit ribosomal protein L10|nr:50S ribosomal protein L10 [Bacteroidaceae bacterium]MBP8602577.1 50S ribosomal protein L10 [Bacteroidaceae bacterium]OPZ48596.1 MAG: 50S ribosomal protein L10 [Bacteroidetes bacterium ADurb.BinA104]HOD68066.1 50S ribosomal protein L10 [Bacteroidaceae bacterium]HQL25575.1 50S ribosomal protein L10 [Bacteroidaceae bacterium]
MKKENKALIIESLKQTIQSYPALYLVDVTGLNSVATVDLRRKCFKSEVKMIVVKNTLLQKALEQLDIDYSPLYGSLKGTTALMLANTANVPAKLLKDVSDKKTGIPGLKAAYAEESFYIGADQLETLVNIKSKKELIADIVALLQSPAKNVVSALQSGANTIHGVLKTLGEKEN